MAQEESVNLGQLLSYALPSRGFALPADDSARRVAVAAAGALEQARVTPKLLIELGRGRKIATIVAKQMASMLLDQGEAGRGDGCPWAA